MVLRLALKKLIPESLKSFGRNYLSMAKWRQANYASPSPHFIKQAVLLRHGITNARWVETGTHYGYTTKLLARKFQIVYTIEPSAELYEASSKTLSRLTNVVQYLGTSEQHFAAILEKLSGNVCFWLDGHYSGGNTYQARTDTPIISELKSIAAIINKLDNVVILIDDVRCCHTIPAEFPSINHYVNWALECDLDWTIEHDIFIAKTKGLNLYP